MSFEAYMLLMADPGLRCLMIEPMRSAAMMKDFLMKFGESRLDDAIQGG